MITHRESKQFHADFMSNQCTNGIMSIDVIVIVTIFIYELTAYINTVSIFLWKFLGEDDGTPLQFSCLENPVDGGAW